MTTWELQRKIHKAVKEKLRIGISEQEVAQIISEICPDWQGDLISGERTAEIEGPPTDRVIKNGDTVLLDLQVCVEGQWSDLTRVYFIGDMSDEQNEAYDSILRALKEGEKLLRPGTKVKDLWTVMRETINSEYSFTHHGGHAIGKETVVIEPRFVPESEEILQEGMIVTLEPGVYYPGDFGIRLENNYVITPEGFCSLCNLPLDKAYYIVKG